MQFRTPCALGLVLTIAAAPVMAQEAAPAGDRVVVKADGPRQTLRGRLVSLDQATLTIDVPNDSRSAPPVDQRLTLPIARLREVVIVKRDPIWNGAILGAVFLGVCAATWCQQGLDKPSTGADVILAAGMGALVFGGVDALWIDRKTIYKASARKQGPSASGARVSFSVRF